MSSDDKTNDPTGTILDAAQAPRRMKSGLVPADTGIYLRIEEGTAAGRTFMLSSGGVYIIGREGADIEIDDSKVSRKHAELGLYGTDVWVLRDLASTNGTSVNGRRVDDRAKLKHWDLIRVGDTRLRFAVIEKAIKVA
ncbi:MAG TPA: FHA domain-containing protein [Candidatus Cryosericum sp.]|nr:FHA domain-containing protein [Candidatus Cryosericum sp.]